jgi:hypothetical protein
MERFQKLPQKSGPLVGRNTDVDARHVVTHGVAPTIVNYVHDFADEELISKTLLSHRGFWNGRTPISRRLVKEKISFAFILNGGNLRSRA